VSRHDNRAGLPAVRYRVAAEHALREQMLARMATLRLGEGPPPLRALTARHGSDFALAFLGLWALVADTVTFYQERIANEAFIGTARTEESVRRLAAHVGHAPRPGRAAATQVAFTLDKDAATLLPVGTRLQGRAADGQVPQIYETAAPLRADAGLNELRLRTAWPQRLPAGAVEATLAGVDLGLQPGDPLLFGGEGLASARAVRIVATVGEALGATRVTWDEPLPALEHPTPHRFRHRASLAALPSQRTLGAGPWPPGKAPPGTAVLSDRCREAEAGGWLAAVVAPAEGPARASLHAIVRVEHTRGAEDPLRYPVTCLLLNPPLPDPAPGAPLQLHLAPAPLVLAPLTGRSVVRKGERRLELASRVAGLEPGRWLALDAQTPGGESLRQAVVLEAVAEEGEDGVARTVLTLRNGVDAACLAASVVVLGNVVPATHGAAQKPVVLGSGDAGLAFQWFTLPQGPIAVVLAPDAPRGVRSTLEVLVDGVRWQPVGSLLEAGPGDRVYVEELDADGATRVRFGDGAHGARLPTGHGNVVARFRVGIGVVGNAPAGQIDGLPTPPRGVKAARNVVPASGGVEPEGRDATRHRAPRTTRLLGAIASLRDFEDAALQSPSIATARATSTLIGGRHGVRLVVAGEDGRPVADAERAALRAFLDAHRDAHVPLCVQPHRPVPVRVCARLACLPGHGPGNVRAAAEAALRAHFEARRGLGATLPLSAVYAVLQAVPGVASAAVLEFGAAPAANADAWAGGRAPAPLLRLGDDEAAFLPPDGLTLVMEVSDA
jgi:phage-related baseplate assembly protein